MTTPDTVRAFIASADAAQLAMLLTLIFARLIGREEASSPVQQERDRPLHLGTAARELGISRDTLAKLVARGEIPVVRVGDRPRILSSTITAYLRRGHGLPEIPRTLLGRRLERRPKGKTQQEVS